MEFFNRYVQLAEENGMKPQQKEMLRIVGVSSATVDGWKNGSRPRIDVIYRLADHFHVTADYVLGLSDEKQPGDMILSEEERLLVMAYRSASPKGRFNIITTCTIEENKIKGEVQDVQEVQEAG